MTPPPSTESRILPPHGLHSNSTPFQSNNQFMQNQLSNPNQSFITTRSSTPIPTIQQQTNKVKFSKHHPSETRNCNRNTCFYKMHAYYDFAWWNHTWWNHAQHYHHPRKKEDLVGKVWEWVTELTQKGKKTKGVAERERA